MHFPCRQNATATTSAAAAVAAATDAETRATKSGNIKRRA